MDQPVVPERDSSSVGEDLLTWVPPLLVRALGVDVRIGDRSTLPTRLVGEGRR
jgi:hypothetical protein